MHVSKVQLTVMLVSSLLSSPRHMYMYVQEPPHLLLEMWVTKRGIYRSQREVAALYHNVVSNLLYHTYTYMYTKITAVGSNQSASKLVNWL